MFTPPAFGCWPAFAGTAVRPSYRLTINSLTQTHPYTTNGSITIISIINVIITIITKTKLNSVLPHCKNQHFKSRILTTNFNHADASYNNYINHWLITNVNLASALIGLYASDIC